MLKNNIFKILFITVILILNQSIVSAKYIFQDEFCIAKINVDMKKPKIEVINVGKLIKENNNDETFKTNIDVKVSDTNLKDVFFDNEHLIITIGFRYVKEKNIKILKIRDDEKEKVFQIELTNLSGEGKLILDFLEGLAVDKTGLENDENIFDTGIVF